MIMRRVFFKFFKTFILILGLVQAFGASNASSAESSPDVHVHGLGNLNIVLQANEIEIEIEIPAENIVGFEYSPKTKEEIEKIEQAVSKLQEGDQMFTFPDAAKCLMDHVKVTSSLIRKHGETNKNKSKHKHEHEHKHEHDEHKHETKESGDHAEFLAIYSFNCDKIDQVVYMNVELLKFFKSLEKLRARFVTSSRQGAAVITPNSSKVVFK